MSRFLVTGGAGFIGSHLAEHCLRAGNEVVVLDNLLFGRRENLRGMDLNFIEGSILEEERLRSAMEGCSGVFHLAAVPSVPRSVEDPLRSHEVNATGTLRVLLAARDLGAKVVYAGSSSAYGGLEALPKSEDMPVAPLSPYAATKLSGEHLTAAFARVYGMETVILRYFNVYGPRQPADSPYSGVIAKFCTTALEGGTCLLEGDGRQSRDFTYVADVARGNLMAMEASVPGGTLLNLAGGCRYSLLRFLEVLEEVLGTPVDRRKVDPRPGDVRHSQASVEKAGRLLGFRTEVTFEEGIGRTLDWYREEGYPTRN